MEPRILRFGHNSTDVMSLKAFQNIKDGINRDFKDAYFVRAIGANSILSADILKMDADMSRMTVEGKCFYSRIAALPRMSAVEDVEYYTSCYTRWEENGKTTISVKTLTGNGAFGAAAGRALADVLTIFRGNGAATASIEKNFGVKLLFWLDVVMQEILTEWDEKKTVKVVMENISKKQEYFFAYFLALLGCDVLLLQTAEDIAEELKALDLSGGFSVGEFAEIKLPAYDRKIAAQQVKERQKDTQNAAAGQMQGAPSSGEQQPVRVQIPPRAGRRSQAPAGSQPARQTQSSGNNHTQQQPQSAGNNQPARQAQSLPYQQPSRPAGNILLPPTRPAQQPVSGERRELSYEELAQLAKSVVMIAIRDKNGEVIGTGSGIMVGRGGYILTNNHVASGGCSYSVRIEEEENTYDTDEVIKYNPVLDLAVIRIQRELQPLPVYKGKEPLVRGQKVVAIGSPLGFFNSVSDGIIAGFRTIDMVDMIQFTAPTSPGSSGGAVLNMYGEVIGISTAGLNNAQNINLAMGYECINSFIQGFIG